MSKVVRDRLKEICPDYHLSDVDIDEIESDVKVAFEIIGYEPQNFNDSFHRAWESSDATLLWEFVYDIWRLDE